jgi:hypothetical protein
MYRSPRKLSGLLAVGVVGLSVIVAACTQPGASPSPSAMMQESPSAMMQESPSAMMESPSAMMASPSAMMQESPSAMMESPSPSQ